MMPVNMWRCSGTTVHKLDSGSRGPVSRPRWVTMLGRALYGYSTSLHPEV